VAHQFGPVKHPAWVAWVRGAVVLLLAFLLVREALYWVESFRTGCSATPQIMRLTPLTRVLCYGLVAACIAVAYFSIDLVQGRRPLGRGLGLAVAALVLGTFCAGHNFAAYIPYDMCKSGGLIEHGPFGFATTELPGVFVDPRAERGIGASCALFCLQGQARSWAGEAKAEATLQQRP